MKPQQLRQGDVQLQPVSVLPEGCTEIPAEGNRIVLAHGEVTGHAHAIYDHLATAATHGAVAGELARQRGEAPAAANEIADAAIARARTKARLWRAPSGERFLEVKETVTLRHEEHTAHTLPPGIYQLPTQMEYEPAELRRVQD
ncbi:MAG: hypothetical protein KIH64_015065 [Mycobacterium sp.]|nr:hypothetical protein [Mycobacterium sp.]